MVKTTKTTETTHETSLSKKFIIEALKQFGANVPDNCEIYVRVPTGGDWSGCNLDIDDDHCIEVRWKETTKNSG